MLSILDQTLKWLASNHEHRRVRCEADSHACWCLTVDFESHDVADVEWLKDATELSDRAQGSIWSVHLVPLR
jgi:hypothetical protein